MISVDESNRAAIDGLVTPVMGAGDRAFAIYQPLVSGSGFGVTTPNSDLTAVFASELASQEELALLLSSIRDHRLAQLTRPRVIFSTNRDGVSLATLFECARQRSPSAETLLLVLSVSGRSLIGAFCTDAWFSMACTGSYFGRGGCFLFRLRPGPACIYPWCGDARRPACNRFQRRPPTDSTSGLEIGGGLGSGPAGLAIDANLSTGFSGPTETFSSDCLITASEDRLDMSDSQLAPMDSTACRFLISAVELIGFEEI
ncbi:unnamed protein product [Protopolystoma xenopodis]|uniref:TLDc domain-containing protein n=1 Tax=Protopolystoma xenopodis TaxID=117903 RepID=A0A448WG75_9PLAT|nr:unnamed protein product [Protopolystoma xenopodis]